MKILFAYYHHSSQLSVIQQGLINAFKKCGYQVITCGRVIQQDVKLDHKYRNTSVSVLKLLKKESNIDLIFVCWPSGNFWVSDIEKSPVPTAVYAIDTQLPLVKSRLHGYVKLFDYIFCIQKDFADLLTEEGLARVFWLPPAVDINTQRNLHLSKKYDVSFVGTTNFLHNPRRSLYLTLLKIMFNIHAATAYNWKMTQIYSQSKIVFNVPVTDDLNARVFEVLGTGSLLITPSYQQGLSNLFKPGASLVTYTSIFDAVRQIQFYLNHPIERQRIARTGELLVRKKHTYENRIRFIMDTVTPSRPSKRFYSTKDRKDISTSLSLMGASKLKIGLKQKYTHRLSAIKVILWQLLHV